jgi:anthranilate/para-aminobenzoate synthase component I
MDIFPGRSDFASAYGAGRAQVMWSELPADLDTPVSVMLKLGQEQPYTALLESVQKAVRDRYSFIALKPDIIWRCNGERAEIYRGPVTATPAFTVDGKPTLASLRSLIKETRMELPAHLPPMAAGLIGFMGYDTVRLAEDIPNDNPDKIKAIEQIQAPKTVKDVRHLTGCVAALSRFISKSTERALPFFKVLKKAGPVEWTPKADAALQDLKAYLSSVPTLVAPKPQEPLLLYLAATNQVVSVALVAQREVDEEAATTAFPSGEGSELAPARSEADQGKEERGNQDSSKVTARRKVV